MERKYWFQNKLCGHLFVISFPVCFPQCQFEICFPWNMNSKKSNAFTVSPFAKSDWFYSPPARWGSSYLKEPVYTNTLAPTDALGVFGDLYAWLVGLMCPLCRCLGTYSPQMSHVSWCFIIHFFMLFLVFLGGLPPFQQWEHHWSLSSCTVCFIQYIKENVSQPCWMQIQNMCFYLFDIYMFVWCYYFSALDIVCFPENMCFFI